jgi:hypothetical protein
MENNAKLKQVCIANKPQKEISLRKTLVSLTWIAAIVAGLSTTGCAHIIMRSMMVEKASIPKTPPAPGSGRLFVYVVEGGPNPLNMIGIMSYCSVDEMVCSILGSSCWYIDLPAGTHKVTADGVANDTWIYKPRYGKNIVQFDLKEGEFKYCKIDLDGFGAFTSFAPVMIEADVAEAEMAKLEHYKDFKTKRTIK